MQTPFGIKESISKVLIINPQNECLVLTLSEHRKRPDRSFTPDLPGGIVDDNESDADAAVREVHEECGITLNPSSLELVHTQTYIIESQNKSVTKNVYIARLDSTPPVKLSWEHSSYEWVPVEELGDIELRPDYKAVVKNCLSKGPYRGITPPSYHE